MLMFTGEFSCFLGYAYKLYMDKRKKAAEGYHEASNTDSPGAQARQVLQKTNINPMLLAIPASCDVCASTLTFVGLTMVPPSVYQMMRGFIVVVCAMFSIIFLKKRLYRHHWTAVACIVIGEAAIGFVSIQSGKKNGGEGSEFFGIMLLLISQLFQGTMFITEEYLFRDYYLEPFKAVGTEGMWGNAYYLVFLPIMQLIQCGSQIDPKGLGHMCNYGYLENSAFMFYQMGQNGVIIFLCFLTIFVCAGYNACGISVTKYASAAQRSTIDTGRTVSIWIVSLLLGLESFVAWQVPGFLILTFGTLLFNEIIVLPWLGFDQYTKEAIAKREGLDDRMSQKLTDQDYASGSPQRAYDQSRTRRSVTKKLVDQENEEVRRSMTASMQLKDD